MACVNLMNYISFVLHYLNILMYSLFESLNGVQTSLCSSMYGQFFVCSFFPVILHEAYEQVFCQLATMPYSFEQADFFVYQNMRKK